MAKDFHELGGPLQVGLLVALLKRLAERSVPSLESLAEAEGKTPHAIWREICEACGVDPCRVPGFLIFHPAKRKRTNQRTAKPSR